MDQSSTVTELANLRAEIAALRAEHSAAAARQERAADIAVAIAEDTASTGLMHDAIQCAVIVAGVLVIDVAIALYDAAPGWVKRGIANAFPQRANAEQVLRGGLSGDTRTLGRGDVVGSWEVTSGYGNRIHPVTGQPNSMHYGVDLVNTEGKTMGHPLYMPLAGTVKCFWSGGGGNVAEIKQGDVELRLLHLQYCEPGQYQAGEIFGAVGNTGSSTTGPHLHAEYYPAGGIRPITVEWIESLLGIATERADSITALRRAIIGQESQGDFAAVNPDSGALGYGQVMPSNVPSWTQQCLGYELTTAQFLADPDAQVRVIDCKLTEYLDAAKGRTDSYEQQIREVAAQWYSGDPKLWNNTSRQFYGSNEYPSISDYTASIWDKYLREK